MQGPKAGLRRLCHPRILPLQGQDRLTWSAGGVAAGERAPAGCLVELCADQGCAPRPADNPRGVAVDDQEVIDDACLEPILPGLHLTFGAGEVGFSQP